MLIKFLAIVGVVSTCLLYLLFATFSIKDTKTFSEIFQNIGIGLGGLGGSLVAIVYFDKFLEIIKKRKIEKKD